MFELIKANLLRPLLERVGTSAATILVGYGVQASYREQIGIAVMAAGCIAFDLAVSYVNRQRAKGR